MVKATFKVTVIVLEQDVKEVIDELTRTARMFGGEVDVSKIGHEEVPD